MILFENVRFALSAEADIRKSDVTKLSLARSSSRRNGIATRMVRGRNVDRGKTIVEQRRGRGLDGMHQRHWKTSSDRSICSLD